MKTISVSAASKDLGSLVEEVWESRIPVIIEREDGHSAVVISKAEFDERLDNGMDETEYLLSNPENAKSLLAAIDDIEHGRNMRERQLIEE